MNLTRADFLRTSAWASIGFLFAKPKVEAPPPKVVYSFPSTKEGNQLIIDTLSFIKKSVSEQKFYDAEKWERFFATRDLHGPAFNPRPYGGTHGLLQPAKGFQFGIDQDIPAIVGELAVPGLSTIGLNPADTLTINGKTINGKTISWE